MKLLLSLTMLLSLEAMAGEKLSLNAGFGILTCEVKSDTYKCTVPAKFAEKIEIDLVKIPGSNTASGMHEFKQIVDGHSFTGAITATKYTLYYASYYSLSITMNSDAKKAQFLGSVFFPDANKLNVASWIGSEIAQGNTYLVPVMAAASPTENLAPLREEILRRGFKK